MEPKIAEWKPGPVGLTIARYCLGYGFLILSIGMAAFLLTADQNNRFANINSLMWFVPVGVLVANALNEPKPDSPEERSTTTAFLTSLSIYKEGKQIDWDSGLLREANGLVQFNGRHLKFALRPERLIAIKARTTLGGADNAFEIESEDERIILCFNNCKPKDGNGLPIKAGVLSDLFQQMRPSDSNDGVQELLPPFSRQSGMNHTRLLGLLLICWSIIIVSTSIRLTGIGDSLAFLYFAVGLNLFSFVAIFFLWSGWSRIKVIAR